MSTIMQCILVPLEVGSHIARYVCDMILIGDDASPLKLIMNYA